MKEVGDKRAAKKKQLRAVKAANRGESLPNPREKVSANTMLYICM